jgi:hypothetical protein
MENEDKGQLQTRKFRALLFGVALQALPMLMTFVLVLHKDATYQDFLSLIKWLSPSLATMITGYILAHAYSDRTQAQSQETKHIDVKLEERIGDLIPVPSVRVDTDPQSPNAKK